MAAVPSTPSNLQRLESLEVTVREQAERIAKLEAVIAGMAALFGGGAPVVADDRDLDSPKGDEKVRFDPRDWKGTPQKGLTMSRCLPEFLELYAETMTYFASKQTDAKKAGFDKKTAARALGWARRIRGGWRPPPAAPAPSFGGGTGGGFGTPSTFGANGGGFGQSNGHRGFLGAAPPAAPAPPPADSEPIGDDEFPFGANASAPATSTPTTEDDDDDPPL
jgi:hypothetical protein